MNWKTAFFVSIIALATSLFWGINKPSVDCMECPCATDGNLQIPTDSALIGTGLYTKFRKDVKIKKEKKKIGVGTDSVDTQVLIDHLEQVRGFQLQHCELSEMLLKQGPGAEVWAMLCVRPVPHKKRNQKNWELDLLFQVRSDNSVADGLPPDEDDFYDFTEPCPNACPD